MESLNNSSATKDDQHDEAGFENEEITSSQRKKKLVGLLGCGLLILGVFLPIISLPIVGSMNYIHNGRGDGVIVLALAVVSGLLILRKLFRGLIVTGLLALAVMCLTLCQFLAYLSKARSDMAQSDNIFKGLGEAMLATVQIQWGWVPLVAGGFMILTAGLLRDELHDASGRIIPVSQANVWKSLVITGAVFTGALAIASWFPPDFLQHIRIPTLKSEDSSKNSSAPLSTPSSPGASEPRGWQFGERTSEMDGKKSAYLYLAAEEKIAGLIGDVSPTLHIWCQDGRVVLYINTDTMVDRDIWSNTSRVRIRFDDRQPVSQRWNTSTDHQALFAPNTVQLIKELSAANVFLFEFMPYNKGAQVVKFNVGGLASHISKIAEACPRAKLQ